MTRARTAVLSTAVAVLAVICAFGAYTAVVPAYTDQELRASIVDTWEAQAFFTSAVLVGIAVITVVALAVAYRSGQRFLRRLAVLAMTLSVCSSALILYSHASLTERATRLTGHSFGPFYGLF